MCQCFQFKSFLMCLARGFLLNNTVHIQLIIFSVLLTKVAACSPEPHLFECSRQKGISKWKPLLRDTLFCFFVVFFYVAAVIVVVFSVANVEFLMELFSRHNANVEKCFEQVQEQPLICSNPPRYKSTLLCLTEKQSVVLFFLITLCTVPSAFVLIYFWQTNTK